MNEAKEENVIIGFAGAIREAYGIDILLDIANEEDICLKLAGKIVSNELDRRINDDKLTKNGKLKYVGFIPSSQLESFYSDVNVGVIPYRNIMNSYYGIPTKLLEYMKYGIPVISVDFPLYKEIIEDAKCGILVHDDVKKEIVEAIGYFKSHPEEAKRLGENGRLAIEKKYNWNIEKKKLFAAYNSLSGDNRKILHIGYSHPKDDMRIVQKECKSLTEEGYDVTYVTHNEAGGENCSVKIISLKNKNDSIMVNYFINKGLRDEYMSIIEELRPDIIHIHEYGISYLVGIIKKKYPSIKVIYDVHEDNENFEYESDMKKYGKFFAKVLCKLRGRKEKEAWKMSDAVITVTSFLFDRIKKYNDNVYDVRNYPIV